MLAALTLFLLSLPGAASQEPAAVTAFEAGRLLTMAGEPVDTGVLVVRGGRIVAVGRRDEVAIPAGAEIVDLGDDAFVLPGLVDLHHHVSGRGDINDMVHPINAELRTLDVVRPTEDMIRRTVTGGVTTTLFIPGSGSNIGGFGVLMKMRHGEPLDRLVLRELGAMKVAQGYNPERRAGDLGETRMGMHELLTQALLEGRDYAESWRAYHEGRGYEPELEPGLEQLRKVFDKEVPVIIHTAGARDCVATARMFQDVFDVRMILSHGTFDGWWAASALAKRRTPVNLGPRMFDLDDDGHMQGIAAGYWNAGCTDLSINTDAPVIPPEELTVQAAMAVRLGLPYVAALEALTIVPARQIGMGDRLGSLEPGKDADFFVTRGDPLDPRNPPERVYIEGRLVYSLKDMKR